MKRLAETVHGFLAPIGLFEAWLALKELEAVLPRWRAEIAEMEEFANANSRISCSRRTRDVEPPSLGPIVDDGFLRDLDIE